MNEKVPTRSIDQLPDHAEAACEMLEHYIRRWRNGHSPQDDGAALILVARIIARQI